MLRSAFDEFLSSATRSWKNSTASLQYTNAAATAAVSNWRSRPCTRSRVTRSSHRRAESEPERPGGLRAACHVLPPALLHWLIVSAGARTRIGRLGVPIGLEKKAEAVVAPVVASRNADTDRRPAHQEAALGLVVKHRDELGVIVGLAAQRLVRDDRRGSPRCSRRHAIERLLPGGGAGGRVPWRA